jgi:hypothetical protein
MEQAQPFILFIVGILFFAFIIHKISSKFKVNIKDANVPGKLMML